MINLEFLPTLLQSTLVTLLILAFAAPLTILVAFAFGLARLSRHGLVRIAARILVEFFRGVSALILLFWLFFALPMLGISLPPIVCAVLALGFSAGSYGAEVVRSAVLSVPKVQTEAAKALNFRRGEAMIRIILPQAIVTMLPPFGNLMIEVLKSTALVSMITVADLTFRAVQLNATYLRTIEVFTQVLIIYFIIALCITALVRVLESRLGRFRMGTP